MRRLRRGETGDVVLGGIVVFGLLAGAAFLSYTAFLSIREASIGEWRPGSERIAAQAPLDLNVGPAPPSDGRDCILDRMANSPHRFRYTANGWRSDDFAMPALTGDRAVDRGAVSVWKAGFEGFVGSELAEAIKLCQRPAQTVAPTTSTTAPPISLSGLYRLEYLNTRQCTLPSPDPMARVEASGRTLTITFSPSNGRIGGALDPDGRFEASLTQGAASIRAQGTLGPFGDRVFIRNGLLTLNQAGLACEFTFTGERVGN